MPVYSPDGCPFCLPLVEEITPTFEDGTRIHVGESITFPNLYPFASYHVVTTITQAHFVEQFSVRQIADALAGQVRALTDCTGYISINWNYLPSAGASLPHPHLQGLADALPDTLPSRYIDASLQYQQESGRQYREDLIIHEEKGGRVLTGTRLFWYVHPVPIGEREIRCLLPITTVEDFFSVIDDYAADLLQIINLYRELGTFAFNVAIFFGLSEEKSFFHAFSTIISRINPNPLSGSDTAFMERLHLEPVILTLPEDLASFWRECAESGNWAL